MLNSTIAQCLNRGLEIRSHRSQVNGLHQCAGPSEPQLSRPREESIREGAGGQRGTGPGRAPTHRPKPRSREAGPVRWLHPRRLRASRPSPAPRPAAVLSATEGGGPQQDSAVGWGQEARGASGRKRARCPPAPFPRRPWAWRLWSGRPGAWREPRARSPTASRRQGGPHPATRDPHAARQPTWDKSRPSTNEHRRMTPPKLT